MAWKNLQPLNSNLAQSYAQRFWVIIQMKRQIKRAKKIAHAIGRFRSFGGFTAQNIRTNAQCGNAPRRCRRGGDNHMGNAQIARRIDFLELLLI